MPSAKTPEVPKRYQGDDPNPMYRDGVARSHGEEVGGCTSVLREVADAAAQAINVGALPNIADPTRHRYTTHDTYIGEGCAMCGRPEEEHQTI